MLSALSSLIYLKISPERIFLKNLKSGNTISDFPILALNVSNNSNNKVQQTVYAVGKDALQAKKEHQDLILKNGFEHPRVVIGEFAIAEKTVQHFLRQLDKQAIFRIRPVVILHPLGNYDGGLSSIEINALKEIAIGAGARKVFIWQGRELTDHEIKTGTFPLEGWLQGVPDWIKS